MAQNNSEVLLNDWTTDFTFAISSAGVMFDVKNFFLSQVPSILPVKAACQINSPLSGLSPTWYWVFLGLASLSNFYFFLPPSILTQTYFI